MSEVMCKECGHPAEYHNHRTACGWGHGDKEIICDCRLDPRDVYLAELARLAALVAEAKDIIKRLADEADTPNDWPLPDSALIVAIPLPWAKRAAALLKKMT